MRLTACPQVTSPLSTRAKSEATHFGLFSFDGERRVGIGAGQVVSCSQLQPATAGQVRPGQMCPAGRGIDHQYVTGDEVGVG
jgi:hypothetical protein